MTSRGAAARSLAWRTTAVAAVLAIAGVGVYAATQTDSSDGQAGASSASSAEASTASSIQCTDASGNDVPCLPSNETGQIAEETVRQPIGWGSAQPANMGATVQRGSTDAPLTAERRDVLASQLKLARATAERIGTVGRARELGYVQNNQEWIDGRGYEFVNWDWFQPTLNWDRPGVLVAGGTDDDSPILSIAYNVTQPREDGPPSDLPLEVIPWHYHHNLCRVGDQVIGNVETREDGTLDPAGAKRCMDAGAVYMPEYDHWMVDLWVVAGWENPWGLVSSKHPDLYRDPEPWFRSGSGAAPGSH